MRWPTDSLGLGRFRDKYAAKMAETPDARAFEIVSAPLGTSGDEFARDRACRRLRRHAGHFSARHEGALSGFRRGLAGNRAAAASPNASVAPTAPSASAAPPQTRPAESVLPAVPPPRASEHTAER